MSLSFKTEAYSWRALTLRVVSIIGLLLGIWLSFDETLIDSVTTTPAIAEAVAAPTSAPKNKTVAIREIQPAGHKVLADNPQTPGQAEGDFGEFDSQTWQVHRFLMEKPDGGWLKIGLARPMAWIESVKSNDSGQVWLEFEELGIADWATVQATEPCPTDITGEGRLVTGTFEHSSGEVLNLFIAGEATPIGSTANHPFWSEDRQDFVQAGSLEPGEHLRLADGRMTSFERAEPIATQFANEVASSQSRLRLRFCFSVSCFCFCPARSPEFSVSSSLSSRYQQCRCSVCPLPVVSCVTR